MLISQITKSALLFVGFSVLAGCSSDARFHEIQSARLMNVIIKPIKSITSALKIKIKILKSIKNSKVNKHNNL